MQVQDDIWRKVDAKTAALREEGLRLLDRQNMPAESRADRIRTAVARRDVQDQVIAEELRAALDDDFEGDRKGWLAWCSNEFGWGRSQAYKRLDPKQMQEQREDRNRRRAFESRPSRQPEPETEPERPQIVYHADPKVARRKALAIKMIQAGFKKLSMERHPDRGGNTDAMPELADARDWIIDYVENPPLLNLND